MDVSPSGPKLPCQFPPARACAQLYVGYQHMDRRAVVTKFEGMIRRRGFEYNITRFTKLISQVHAQKQFVFDDQHDVCHDCTFDAGRRAAVKLLATSQRRRRSCGAT